MSTFEEQNQNQVQKKQPLSQKIKGFWPKYGEKTVLAIGIILIAFVSFEAGFLKGQKGQNRPVEVNQVACAPCPKTVGGEVKSGTTSDNQTKDNPTKADSQQTVEDQKCAFIASKNSNKYHLPTCQFAQKIKPENRVCFSFKEEAESRGYQGAKCCIK